MSEKINQNQQHPEQPLMLVEKLGLEIDKPIALTAEEVEQIQRELGGFAKAHLDAFAAFLEGKWNQEEYKEKLKQTGGRYTPDTYFDVNDNVRIAPNGHVHYKILNIVMNASRRNDGKKLWVLKWQSAYDVQTIEDDFEKFRDFVELVKEDGQPIPAAVQEKFKNMESEQKEAEQAFERGKKWTLAFELSEENTNSYAFNTESPPESIDIDITLKDGGDPLQPDSWKIVVDKEEHREDIKLYRFEIDEREENALLSFEAGAGDETGGVTYNGEILVDPNDGKIIKGTLSYDHSHPDGGCDGDYKIANDG